MKKVGIKAYATPLSRLDWPVSTTVLLLSVNTVVFTHADEIWRRCPTDFIQKTSPA
jgi:hypothetical protein